LSAAERHRKVDPCIQKHVVIGVIQETAAEEAGIEPEFAEQSLGETGLVELASRGTHRKRQ